jgi:PKD repeat protein
MNGANMGVLTVDIFDGSEWHLSVFRVSGNQGNVWRSQILNLLDYTGKTIMLRFNGKTGNDFRADLSLDNINLYENTVAPTASFLRSNGITCIDGVVELTDRSTNIPTSWEWIISPNTFSFVNGTDSASQNASVQFHGVGVYSISLVSTNAFGSDTTQSLNVTVDPGAPVPVFEDFEGNFTPLGWSLDNPDGQTQWSTRSVVGSNGSSTKAAVLDNFNSGSSGQYDGLVTLNLDLRNTVNPIVIFDVAYAQKSSSRVDSLIIDASFDCGFTYMPTTYQKGGSGLSTASQTASFFAPNSASDWRRDTLDLAAYIGNNVKLRFRNYSDGGNAVYLDNIQIVSGSVVAPAAFFTTPDSLICNNDMILFTDGTSGGAATTYDWDFTNNAIPNSANTAGPHSVRFVNNGTYTVTLTVSNSGGFSQHTFNVYVEETPLTVFSETFQTVQTIQFNDLSTNDPTEWKWYFGDGDSSSVQNPTHTYAQDGTYTVELISGNRCGSSTRTRQVVVQGIGLEEQIGLDNLGLYPNPSKGAFNLSFSSDVPQNLEIDVLDLTGKKVKDINYQVSSGNNQLEFDLSELSKGIYFLRLNTETGTRTLRAIKE